MFLNRDITTKIKNIAPNNQSNGVPNATSLSTPDATKSIAIITITPKVDLSKSPIFSPPFRIRRWELYSTVIMRTLGQAFKGRI